MASDIEIQAREILRMRQRLNELYAKYTGQKIEDIEKAMDRDKFLEADEAKAFGIIDEVFDKRPEAGADEGTGRGISLPLHPCTGRGPARQPTSKWPLRRPFSCESRTLI